MDYFYNDIEHPLKKFKNYVWYNDSKQINKLVKLASVLGVKELQLCGEKDSPEDIAIIRTNEKGDELILENCHLKIVLFDSVSKFSIKNKDGKKIFFDKGGNNVL